MRQLALEAEWIRAWRVAPDIVEAISKERADGALTLERLERPLPASWEEQRDSLVVTWPHADTS